MPKNLFNLKIKPVDIFGTSSTSKKRTSCPKAVKEAVWLKYFGHKMNGKCYVCGRPISYMSFEVGHNKPFAKGGKWNINNLRPICRTCNRSMGTMTIESFKKKYFSKKKASQKKTTKKKKKRKTTYDPFAIKFKPPKLW